MTRPRAQAAALAAALARRGVATLVEPMIEIDMSAAGPLDLAGVQALLCTSANGVAALVRVGAERALPLFAVGAATAAAARRAGFAAVESAAGDVDDLSRLVAARLDPAAGRLLHVAGSAIAGDLAGALAARGFAVARAVLYDARPAVALSEAARRALSRGGIDLALFFSPRSATIFVALARAAGVVEACAGIAAFSLSAAVDRALGALDWRARHVAERPDQEALLAALDRALGAAACLPGAPR